MSTLRIEPVSTDELQIDVSLDGTTIYVVLNGVANLKAVEPLQKLVPELHEEAIRLGVQEVRLDFLSLEFMNSSCFKAFVTWLHQIKTLDKSKQYHVTFLSPTGEQWWQERSLQALRNFARELVRIESCEASK